MNKLAELAIARADALYELMACDSQLAVHPLLKWKFETAEKAYLDALDAIHTGQIRADVEAAIRELREDF